MASAQATVDYLIEQMHAAGAVSSRKMFGEYAIYCDGRMPALVCDDRLFVKITPGGRAFAAKHPLPEAPPYPGAKPCMVVDGDLWDDGEWLSRLIRLTADELPEPKPRKPRVALAKE